MSVGTAIRKAVHCLTQTGPEGAHCGDSCMILPFFRIDLYGDSVRRTTALPDQPGYMRRKVKTHEIWQINAAVLRVKHESYAWPCGV